LPEWSGGGEGGLALSRQVFDDARTPVTARQRRKKAHRGHAIATRNIVSIKKHSAIRCPRIPPDFSITSNMLIKFTKTILGVSRRGALHSFWSDRQVKARLKWGDAARSETPKARAVAILAPCTNLRAAGDGISVSIDIPFVVPP
jgi:hypothetical protein